jgi:excisionase family DNA binding protein
MERKRLWRPEEVADLLSIGRTKVYDLMRSGRLRAVKIDGSRRIPDEALDDFLARLESEDAA